MPRCITSHKTRKGEASCNPTETTNRISLIRLHGVTPPNPDRGERGEVRHIRNPRMLTDWSFGLRLSS